MSFFLSKVIDITFKKEGEINENRIGTSTINIGKAN